MRLSRYLLVVSVLVAIGTGCASTKQVIPLPEQRTSVSDSGKARIYVFRRTGFAGAAMPSTVLDRGTKIGSMGGKGYLCWDRDPENTLISIIWPGSNPLELHLKCEAGHTYYLKHGVIGFVAGSTLTVMTEAEGARLLARSKPPRLIVPNGGE